jgi:hypothetical protein
MSNRVVVRERTLLTIRREWLTASESWGKAETTEERNRLAELLDSLTDEYNKRRKNFGVVPSMGIHRVISQ